MSQKTEEQLETEAAEWFTTIRSGDVSRETREAFETWLHADRAHKVAYHEFEQVYRDLDFVAVEAGVDIESVLGRRRTLWSYLPDWMGRPALTGGALAAIAVAIVSIAIIPSLTDPQQSTIAVIPDFATDVAEIREVMLEDGTIVTLGAKSQIGTEFTRTARTVTLLAGEAFFEVTNDPRRPFFVSAQDTLVRVVGTKFDVKRGADIVHVSVLEGVVEVMKPNDIPAAIEAADTSNFNKQVLTAGERVSAARRVALPEVKQLGQAEPGAWRAGRLAYEDASLAEIVSDLNRYYDRPVRIASSEVGDFRSTVAFRTDDIEQVFEVMAAIHPIVVERPTAGAIVIRRKR